MDKQPDPYQSSEPAEFKLTPEEEERFRQKMQEILEYYKEGGEKGIKHSMKFNRLAMRARGGKKSKKNNANR